MEKSTVNTFLYHAENSSGPFTKLIDITSYPDVFEKPEKLDWSDLSGRQHKYIPGMINLPDYEFDFNYTKDRYDTCKALEGNATHCYQLRFGQNGEYGAWQWQGDIFVTPTSGSVGAVRTGKIVCYPSTDVEEVTIS